MEKSALTTSFHKTMIDLADIDINVPGYETELVNTQHRIANAIAVLGSTTKRVRLDLPIELPCAGKDLLCDLSGIHATSVACLSRLKTIRDGTGYQRYGGLGRCCE